MNKALFRSLALVLVVGLALAALLVSSVLPAGPALGQENDPRVCLVGLGPGKDVYTNLTSPDDYKTMKLFYLTVDSGPYQGSHDGWCIDMYQRGLLRC